MKRLRRMTLIAAVLAGVIAPAEAAEPAQRYDYNVEEATYGDIGTYSFTAARDGEQLSMTTEAHLKVSVLGVALYRQDVQRRERWTGGRLMEFHGVTTENGTAVTVDGRADGDRFVLRSPAGETAAPAGVRPVSPWSAGSPERIMFMPDTGAVTPVRVSPGQDSTLSLGGNPIPVKLYDIDTADGREHYRVWLDRTGIPLKYTLKDADSNATFTLVR